jgi:hypothetical protein
MDDEKEIARRKALLHERRAKLLELLRAEPALKPEEQAAVVYTLAIEPGVREHIPGVVMKSMAQQVQAALEAAQTTLPPCPCAVCKSKRAQA